jgi:hypothetical protein
VFFSQRFFEKMSDCVVGFPDPNLEAAIREAIGKSEGDIMASNLQILIDLSLFNRNISDISGLEYLVNLDNLWLDNNQISDLSPLADLTNLTDLILGSNQIDDIYPLVQNMGIDSGDYIGLLDNPLSKTSCEDYIPELKVRGVIVDHDCL